MDENLLPLAEQLTDIYSEMFATELEAGRIAEEDLRELAYDSIDYVCDYLSNQWYTPEDTDLTKEEIVSG